MLAQHCHTYVQQMTITPMIVLEIIEQTDLTSAAAFSVSWLV